MYIATTTLLATLHNQIYIPHVPELPEYGPAKLLHIIGVQAHYQYHNVHYRPIAP